MRRVTLTLRLVAMLSLLPAAEGVQAQEEVVLEEAASAVCAGVMANVAHDKPVGAAYYVSVQYSLVSFLAEAPEPF